MLNCLSGLANDPGHRRRRLHRLQHRGRAVRAGRPWRSATGCETGDKWRNLAKRDLVDVVAPEALQPWLAAHGADARRRRPHGRDLVDHRAPTPISSSTSTSGCPATLWRWCAEHGTRFVYASSAATYGDGSAGLRRRRRRREALARLRPLNAYGWSKHLFDRRVARRVAAGEPAPPQWVGLKFFNVYGPERVPQGHMQSVVAQKYPLAAAGAAGDAVHVAPPGLRRRRPAARLRLRRRLRRRGAVAARPPGGQRPVQPRHRPGSQSSRTWRGRFRRRSVSRRGSSSSTMPEAIRDRSTSTSPRRAWTGCARPATTARSRRSRTASDATSRATCRSRTRTGDVQRMTRMRRSVTSSSTATACSTARRPTAAGCRAPEDWGWEPGALEALALLAGPGYAGLGRHQPVRRRPGEF